ncbi:uncharacterized protein PGTG_08038 [Puccinia graminis f. sp. tritici CRL 75-36-700-3]|uniref:Uncharacterized protein n=1 Tax=Puccinia graminis f. sp. tritici (strain CRL 75-36-700-3 / race SCCL) TaxID=418459 RepID=E3KBY7_PUCGT|nr:uncharacterized protein PGTG_08038 [Puccinia graminis f. sp. tritici CRL 75-36-700-3]EFP81789.2 hypothetical protein PGTG_08038 [Puccinia graminis f. sp. tritici CRL 75-36-700-3]
MPPKKTIPPPATPSQPPSQTKKKKPAVSWDKDGADGFSSIRVLLDWLAVEGNYQRWRGDTKAGSTKSALANEILSLMADCGITHRDNKGIQTKIQELQNSYSKASDFLRNTGSGLQEEDIANGTKTLEMALVKLCKYWDELHPIMATRTVAIPLHTTETTSFDVPNLLSQSDSDDNTDEDPATIAAASEPNLQTSEPADTPDVDDEPDTPPVVGTKSAAASARSGGTKMKSSRKSESYLLIATWICLGEWLPNHLLTCRYRSPWTGEGPLRGEYLQVRKERDSDKKAAEKDKLEATKKRIKLEAARNRTMIDVERRKIKLAEREALMKIREFESNEIDKRIKNMKDLKELGHSTEEIKEFFAAQFNIGRGEGSNNRPVSLEEKKQIVELLSDSDEMSSGDSSDGSGGDE